MAKRESGMGFMPCSMTKSFQNKYTFVKNIFKIKKCRETTLIYYIYEPFLRDKWMKCTVMCITSRKNK